MIINLSEVINYSKDSLQSRALMRSIMLDLYPGKTREMNILLNVYESGIPKIIKNDQAITDSQYAQYIAKIVDEYGMQEQCAIEGLNAWIDVCLGNGKSDKLHYSLSNLEEKSLGKHEYSNTYNESKKTVDQYDNAHNSPMMDYGNHVPTDVSVKKEPVANTSDYQFQKIASDAVKITKFIGIDDGCISIPSRIDGCEVISIGKDAFADCKYMTEVIIPEGVVSIEDAAFRGCERLKKVVFPSTLKNIGTRVKVDKDVKLLGMVQRGSFYQCGMLSSINVPDGVDFISAGAFAHCGLLSNVAIPDNISYIGNSAFANTKIKNIRFPHGIKYINDYAFTGCDFQEITLPDGIERIGEGAFSHCHELSRISLPATIRSIANRAFEGCYKLNSIELKEGVEVIGDNAFAGSDCIKEVLVPRSVFSIGTGAFKSNVTLICYPGTKAVEYGRKNGMRMKSATS